MEQGILLGFWTSPYVMRVKIALLEKEIQFEYKEEDIFENQNKSYLLLKSNPIHKKVPVLIHNGKPIRESLIILQYIDEVWNDKHRLCSDDAHNRARAMFWVDFFDKKIADCGRKMWASKGEEQESGKKGVPRLLETLDFFLAWESIFSCSE